MRGGNKPPLVTVVTVRDSKSHRGSRKLLAESIGKIVTHCHRRHPPRVRSAPVCSRVPFKRLLGVRRFMPREARA
jgi:hypothetical protein